MVTETQHNDFDEAECLCQGKVPKDKWIDFEQMVPVDANGRRIREGGEPFLRNGHPVLKWCAVLRYHKDCLIHGIANISEEPKCRAD